MDVAYLRESDDSDYDAPENDDDVSTSSEVHPEIGGSNVSDSDDATEAPRRDAEPLDELKFRIDSAGRIIRVGEEGSSPPSLISDEDELEEEDVDEGGEFSDDFLSSSTDDDDWGGTGARQRRRRTRAEVVEELEELSCSDGDGAVAFDDSEGEGAAAGLLGAVIREKQTWNSVFRSKPAQAATDRVPKKKARGKKPLLTMALSVQPESRPSADDTTDGPSAFDALTGLPPCAGTATPPSKASKRQVQTKAPPPPPPPLTTIPYSRLARIMRANPNVGPISKSAARLMVNLTLSFLGELAATTGHYVVGDAKKTVAYRHVSRALDDATEFRFLRVVLPPPATDVDFGAQTANARKERAPRKPKALPSASIQVES